MDKIIKYWKELYKRKSYILLGLYIILLGVYLNNKKFITIAIWIRNGFLRLIPLDVVRSINIIISYLFDCFYEHWVIFTVIPITMVYVHSKWLHKWVLSDKILWKIGFIKVIEFMWISGYVLKETIAFFATGMVEIIGIQSWISIALNGVLIVILIFDRLFN